MHGQIRIGSRWHRFSAAEVIAPDTGFVWSGRTRIAGLPVVGFDAYSAGAGVTRWGVFGVPVQSGTGSEATLSAAGRLAAEAVLVPTSLVTASWRPDAHPDTAAYYHHTRGRLALTHIPIRVAPDGRLAGLSMYRWGLRARGSFGLHRFAVDFDDERRFGPVVVPNGLRASWPDGRGEFFRAEIDRAMFG
jgi:hypothetical protein